MKLGNAKTNKIIQRTNNNRYYEDGYRIDANSTNDSHALLVKDIKPETIVLDVGCSSGATGRFLKERGCKVYGIEIDEVARSLALKTNAYEEVWNFNIGENTKEYQDFLNNNITFDYIIFGDVLEHLYDPAFILFETQKKLKINGEILVSIPNIAHVDIILALLKNQFNYSDVGLLDNTHIRFFTKQSFIEMIEDMNQYYHTNFELEYIAYTQVIPEELENYPNLTRILSSKKDFCALQHIFRIKKLSPGQIPINMEEDEEDCAIAIEQEIENLKAELTRIYNSKGYKLLNKFYRLKGRKK